MRSNDDRIVYTDVLRILSMAAVMIIHITAWNINLGTEMNFRVGFCSLMMGATRWSVPLFVMISGVFMLNPNKKFDIGRLYRNNIVRLMSAFFIWSLFYALFENRSAVIHGSFGVIPSILSATFIGHDQYWFILMIVGLYLVTPILRIFISSAQKKDLEYFLIISFLFSCVFPVLQIIPQLALINEFISRLQIMLPVGFTFYYVLGYYLSIYVVEKKTARRLIYIIGVIGIAVAAYMTYLITAGIVIDEGNAFSYLNAAIAVTAAAAFIFGQRHFNVPVQYTKARSIIFKMADYSFGMYLSHDLFNRIALKIEIYNKIDNSIVLLLLMLIVNFTGSFIIAAIIDRIPVARKYCM